MQNNISKTAKKIANLIVVDRSSSMSTIRDKVILGFNEQLQSIKTLDETNGTKSSVSIVYFDSGVEVPVTKADPLSLEPLTSTSYVPNGMTAFYDGLAMGIKNLEDALGSELGETEVLVTTITDGQENSSRKYTGSQVADLIKQFQTDYGWTFNFIGANIDTEQLAQTLNVSASNAINFAATDEGTKVAFDTLRMARTSYYTKKLSGEDTTQDFYSGLK